METSNSGKEDAIVVATAEAQERDSLIKEAGRALRERAQQLRDEVNKLLNQATDAENRAASMFNRKTEIRKMTPDQIREKVAEFQKMFDDVSTDGVLKSGGVNTLVKNREDSLAFYKAVIDFGNAELAKRG